MPVIGKNYELFQPIYDMPTTAATMVGPPEPLIEDLTHRYEWLDEITQSNKETTKTPKERAQLAYLELLKQTLSGVAYGAAERSVQPALRQDRAQLSPVINEAARKAGHDWTYLGDTMTGFKRLDNVRDLLTDVVQNNIEGDYIETGVWRGGSSIFARAVLYVNGQPNRISYVCDSFHGLPPGDRNLTFGKPGIGLTDQGWDKTKYLEVSPQIVAQGFQKYSLLDSNVVFAKGFFNETMPPLGKRIKKLSIMRLDGDMYESTVDVLYHLYDKLSVGGYVIMDDWANFPSKHACNDFFKVHGISPDIIAIDSISAYWKKTEEVELQYWRHEKNQFL